MLVEGHQLAEHRRGELGRHHDSGRAIAGQLAVGVVLLCRRSAEGQRGGLGEAVGHQGLVTLRRAGQTGYVSIGAGRHDEVGGHDRGALVQQLVEGVLAVGARPAPDDLGRLAAHRAAVETDPLAVGLHDHLLQPDTEQPQPDRVRHNRPRLEPPEVAVPHRQQAQQHGDAGRRRCRHMLVDGAHPGQHRREVLLAYGGHHRQTRRRAHREAAADPVPCCEHVVRLDAELDRASAIRGDRHEMPARGLRTEQRSGPGPGGAGVGQRLGRGEALRHHDEQRLGRIEAGQARSQRGRVDVGHEPALKVA